jgi:type II secretory pathway component PulF
MGINFKKWKYEAINEENNYVYGELRATTQEKANEILVKWGYTEIVFIV